MYLVYNYYISQYDQITGEIQEKCTGKIKYVINGIVKFYRVAT